MAKETALELYLGTDHTFIHQCLNEDEDAVIEITGWALSWMIKRSRSQVDASAVLTKTTSSGIAISGTYNADPDVNTQLATVTIADTDTDALTAGSCIWELKRTDAGSETILGYGPITLIRSVHRS
jgi:hypothetical protein